MSICILLFGSHFKSCLFHQILSSFTSWLNRIYLLEESINFLKTNISSS